MLSPECKQGDEKSNLFIIALVNSDGDKAQRQEGQGTGVRAGEGPAFVFRGFPRDGRRTWVGAEQEGRSGTLSYLFAPRAS